MGGLDDTLITLYACGNDRLRHRLPGRCRRQGPRTALVRDRTRRGLREACSGHLSRGRRGRKVLGRDPQNMRTGERGTVSPNAARNVSRSTHGQLSCHSEPGEANLGTAYGPGLPFPTDQRPSIRTLFGRRIYVPSPGSLPATGGGTSYRCLAVTTDRRHNSLEPHQLASTASST